ncbi:unnamed protein product [Protopolystoma xenopodis]|uniref:Uncharacterized protein n=1 Tax=Protopolystoma xenopodis TaxID=117903 RepID=A0A3S5CH64_9PLAT|nr:unnamed protein product [Protopolystoma xenopodis]
MSSCRITLLTRQCIPSSNIGPDRFQPSWTCIPAAYALPARSFASLMGLTCRTFWAPDDYQPIMHLSEFNSTALILKPRLESARGWNQPQAVAVATF